MQQIKNVTLGSDIEFFVQTQKGEPIPAIGMVGGSKEQPKSLGQGYYIQEDNVAVEFNVPPAKSIREWNRNIERGFNKCLDVLPAAVRSSQAASLVFDRAYMNHPKAMEFGCEPDINAWTKNVNPRPKAANQFLRSAGGHVHIGWDEPEMGTRFELIRACDVFCSIPALYEDNDVERRKLYGKAGAMRIKPYGVEHRVLSNYWLFQPEYTDSVAQRYYQAIAFINKGHTIAEEDAPIIQEAINTSDLDKAANIHRKYLKMVF